MAAANDDRLIVTAPSDREIVMVRVFNAPRRLVFDAWTKPELLVRWFGPHGWTMTACAIDLRPGGAYRFVQRGPGGEEMIIRGVYREIVRPERLVATEVFGDDDRPPEDETVVTTVLTERDGRTTWTATAVYPSKEIRDAVLQSEMERGLGEALGRLAELVQTPA